MNPMRGPTEAPVSHMSVCSSVHLSRQPELSRKNISNITIYNITNDANNVTEVYLSLKAYSNGWGCACRQWTLHLYVTGFLNPQMRWKTYIPDLCIHDHQRATPHWENNPTSHLIYYHSKHYIEEFVVLIASLKPYLIEHQVILLNCGVIWS